MIETIERESPGRAYQCADCGETHIHKGKRGRLPARCPDCGDQRPEPRIFIRVCKGCDQAFTTFRSRQHNCEKHCDRKAQLTCEWCGQDFKGHKPRGGDHRTGKSYCSQECLGADRRVKSEPVPWETCKFCQTQYIGRGYGFPVKRNASSGTLKFGHKNCPACAAKPSGPHQPIDASRRINRTLTAGNCAHCGQAFVGMRYGDTHIPRYCSRRCGVKHVSGPSTFNGRGFAMTQRTGAAYEPIGRKRVLSADNYTCWICGEQTDPEAEPSSDRYPSVDHVVPLSKGGSHTYDNVRCACFKCNRVKADEVVGGSDDRPETQSGSQIPTPHRSSRFVSAPPPHAENSAYKMGSFR